MELLFLDKYEIFINKFDHFSVMLFNNRARCKLFHTIMNKVSGLVFLGLGIKLISTKQQ